LEHLLHPSSNLGHVASGHQPTFNSRLGTHGVPLEAVPLLSARKINGRQRLAGSALIRYGEWIYAGLMDHQRQGLLNGLLAALTFGLRAPLISTLTSAGSPLVLAGLLYGGFIQLGLVALALEGYKFSGSAGLWDSA